MTLSIDVRSRTTGEMVVVVRGDLGTATSAQLVGSIDALLRARPAAISLDLGLVTYADAGAVGALLQIQRNCVGVACRFNVERFSPALERTLASTGMSGALPRFP
ncbi:STAS domain-containing protein [Dactylosporangium sp. CA-139114]|uniref:STAS domain-containing protein n=1 Tax=Dactylosporangium sp. CA-139114 TaxID=3239931 RepID=UPI003D97208B